MRRKLSYIPRAEGLENKELLSVAVAPHAQVIKAATTPAPIDGYSWGQCTWYAVSEFNKVAPLPKANWHGDACLFFSHAALAGWQTTLDPTKLVPGSIIVWSGGPVDNGVRHGHVAVVDAKPKAGSTQLFIHEMNWTAGFGQVSTATLNTKNLNRGTSYTFVGFVLPKR